VIVTLRSEYLALLLLSLSLFLSLLLNTQLHTLFPFPIYTCVVDRVAESGGHGSRGAAHDAARWPESE